MQIKVRWLGNAGFEFLLGKQGILVDPFLTRPKPRNVYFGRVEPDRQALRAHIRSCDHILVTHTHFDHCMDVPEITRRTGARVYGSHNTCQIMRMAGLPEKQIHEIKAGEEFHFAEITVRVLPAAHPWIPGYTFGNLKSGLRFPLRLRDYRMDACFSFLIQTPHDSILIWSSTRTDGAPRADVLTCRAVSSQVWYQSLLDQVQPAVVLPQHWDDMFQPLSSLSGNPRPYFGAPRPSKLPLKRIDLQAFKSMIIHAQPDCRVILPRIFEMTDLQVS